MAFEKAADSLGDGVSQLGEFSAGGRFYPAELAAVNIHAVEEQHNADVAGFEI